MVTESTCPSSSPIQKRQVTNFTFGLQYLMAYLAWNAIKV